MRILDVDLARLMPPAALARLLSVLLLTLSFHSSLAAELLIVAVNNNDRPFCWRDERGELTGFSVDIGRALCRQMASDCRFVASNFAELVPGVAEKRFDFAVANILRTLEREKVVDFTNAFWRSSSMFVAKPGTIDEISGRALKGRSVGVQTGSVQEKYLREHYADIVSVMSFPTNTERNAALVAGKVDLIFGSTVSHYAFLSTKEGARFDFVGAPLDNEGLGGEVAIPLAKGRDDLRKRLNSAIDTILHDGTFAKINNTYFSASVF
jgi:polar amino acid transport system substrate-binding protein